MTKERVKEARDVVASVNKIFNTVGRRGTLSYQRNTDRTAEISTAGVINQLVITRW